MWALFFTLARKSLKTTYIFGRNQRKIPVDTMNLMDTWPKAPPTGPAHAVLVKAGCFHVLYDGFGHIPINKRERERVFYSSVMIEHTPFPNTCVYMCAPIRRSCKCPCVPSFVASHRLQPAWLAFKLHYFLRLKISVDVFFKFK